MKHLKETIIAKSLLRHKVLCAIMALSLLMLMVPSGLRAAYANDNQQEVSQAQFEETNDSFGITVSTSTVPFTVSYDCSKATCADLDRGTASMDTFTDTNISGGLFTPYLASGVSSCWLDASGFLEIYIMDGNDFMSSNYIDIIIDCEIDNPVYKANGEEITATPYSFDGFDTTPVSITIENGSAPTAEMSVSATTLDTENIYPTGVVANYYIQNDPGNTLTPFEGSTFYGASSSPSVFEDTNISEMLITPSFDYSGFYLNPEDKEQLIYELNEVSGPSVTAILGINSPTDRGYHVEWLYSIDEGTSWVPITAIGSTSAYAFASGNNYLFGLKVVTNASTDITISAECDNGDFDVVYDINSWPGAKDLSTDTGYPVDEYVDTNVEKSIIIPNLSETSGYYAETDEFGNAVLSYWLVDMSDHSVDVSLISNPIAGTTAVWYLNGSPVEEGAEYFVSDVYNFELVYEESPEPEPGRAWHDASVSVDRDPGTRPEGFDGWNVETYFAGIYMPFYSHHYSMPFIYYPELIPDYALIGVDDQYRLHVRYADPVLPFLNWDIYLDACEKPGYEQYAWYVDPAWGFKSIGLDDNADCGEKGSLMLGVGKLYGFAPYMPVHFTAEYIGKVDVSATGGAGHSGLELDYYINNHDVPEVTAVQETWNTYLWEGTVAGVDANGVLEFVNTDDYNNYFECGHLRAVPQDGYVFKSWTIDGVEYPVGQEAEIMTIKYKQAPISVVANYQPVYVPVPDPGQGGGQDIGGGTAQTGDAAGIGFAIAALIAVAGACGTFRARKQIIK